jgi:2-keto-4-pentenoate hydratase/2-oxohepta-3-ene-1,7-dioic acid hydratase in catechol pathway
MKLARIALTSRVCWGIIDGYDVHELKGSIYRNFVITGRRYPLESVRLLTPCKPSKIIAVGRNYADHAQEKKVDLPTEPRIFLKAPSSIIGPGQAIRLPHPDHSVEHEAELAMIIKHKIKNVPQQDALQHILGYTCGNDVSDRTVQNCEAMPSRAKSYDTFTPFGPWIETELDPGALQIECRLNGQLRQSSNTKFMIFDAPAILSFVSGVMTLLPGDVILTGTPGGTSEIQAGDLVEISIEGIGTLRNPVYDK